MAQPNVPKQSARPPGKGGDGPAEARGREARKSGSGWLRWILGWVVAPGLVLGGIFGGGVFVGANHPEAAVVKAVLWVVGLF